MILRFEHFPSFSLLKMVLHFMVLLDPDHYFIVVYITIDTSKQPNLLETFEKNSSPSPKLKAITN